MDDLRKEEKQNISDCSVKLIILIRCANLFLLGGVSSGRVTEQHEQDRQEHFPSRLKSLFQPPATLKQAPSTYPNLHPPVPEQKQA